MGRCWEKRGQARYPGWKGVEEMDEILEPGILFGDKILQRGRNHLLKRGNKQV